MARVELAYKSLSLQPYHSRANPFTQSEDVSVSREVCVSGPARQMDWLRCSGRWATVGVEDKARAKDNRSKKR